MSAGKARDRTERLDPETIMVAAERFVEAHGWDALSMAALAADLGVPAPSLYRHVDSLDGLRAALLVRSLKELADVVRTAVMGKAGLEGLHVLTDAYRSYAHANPVRYLAQSSVPRDDAMRVEGRRAAEAAFAVLASFGLSGDELPVATAQLAGLLHGYVSLELAGVIDFIDDPDGAYFGFVELFAAGLQQMRDRRSTSNGARS